MVMRSIIPVVMAGVLGIYGLITAVIINGKMEAATYSAYSGYAHLGAGLIVGMILILIFAEALGLYGLIVGLVVASTAEGKGKGLCTSYKARACCISTDHPIRTPAARGLSIRA